MNQILSRLSGSEAQPAAASDSEDEGSGEDEEVTFTDVREVLSSDQDQGQFTLPPHLRCASHTLNLISTNDIEKWLTTTPESKSVYRSAIAKCSAPWTKASRSIVAAELVESVCGKKAHCADCNKVELVPQCNILHH